MKLTDRELVIGGIILTIIFGVLSLVLSLKSTTWMQKPFIVITGVLFAISIFLIWKGKKAGDIVCDFKSKRDAKANYKILKKTGIIKKVIKPIDEKKVIKYGYSKFQDTILPLFFDYVHRRALDRYGLKIEFVELPWNGHCRAFEDNLVDVSLSNFSSLLPFYASGMVEDSNEARKIREKAPSTFFPFFEFQGHGVFLRAQLLDKISKQSRREEIKGRIFDDRLSFFEIINEPIERKKLAAEMFGGARVVYEPGTDLEATVDMLLTRMEIKKTIVKPHWEETRLGYDKFLAGEFDVYCGGLVEAFILDKEFKDKRSMDFFPYCSGKDLNVVSPNGLITTQSFLYKHFGIFRELVETWFWSINQLKIDIENADKSLIENIISFLNTSLSKTTSGANVQLNLSKELLDWMVTRGFEHFYTDPIEAFNKYYLDKKCGLLSNSFSFALLAPPETSFQECKSKFKQIGPMALAESLRTIVLNESRKFLPEFRLRYAALQ